MAASKMATSKMATSKMVTSNKATWGMIPFSQNSCLCVVPLP